MMSPEGERPSAPETTHADSVLPQLGLAVIQ